MRREPKICFALAVALLTLLMFTTRGVAQTALQPPGEIKSYRVDAVMNSFDASGSLDSYRGGGELSGSPGSTLGTSTPDEEVSILVLVESNRFYADVSITDRHKADASNPKKQRFDLTDLRPQVLELGTATNGRTYHLSLIPSVQTITLKPKPFKEAADDLYRLRFHSSRVMLNDSKYVGRMLASDAEIFSMEICGVASLEFSLLHLKGAEPWGRLEDGRITLCHPNGTTIEIDNVTNGSDDRLVGNGPYLVWVRWNNPQTTEQEYRAQLTAYRDQIKGGDIQATAGALAAIDKELEREPGPWVVSTGARGPTSQDRIND